MVGVQHSCVPGSAGGGAGGTWEPEAGGNGKWPSRTWASGQGHTLSQAPFWGLLSLLLSQAPNPVLPTQPVYMSLPTRALPWATSSHWL